jgi:hypothetical protein
VTLSLAIFETWWPPLMVIGFILALELVSNNLMEPWLYGQSIGVSEVGLLVAAAFWTFLWGPIGLVLSAPLTVCLVVVGKSVPQLKFIDVLLGAKPALQPDVWFYQRLLARDVEEAKEVVNKYVQSCRLDRVHDELLLPALQQARRDRLRGDIRPVDEIFILETVNDVIVNLPDHEADAQAACATDPPPIPPEEFKRVRLLACPAHTEGDRVALHMVRHLLGRRWDVQVIGSAALTAEVIEKTAKDEPAVVCVGSLAPGGVSHARHLCKRLRARFPDIKLIVGRFGTDRSLDEHRALLEEAGADEVKLTIADVCTHLKNLFPVLAQEPARETVQKGTK